MLYISWLYDRISSLQKLLGKGFGTNSHGRPQRIIPVGHQLTKCFKMVLLLILFIGYNEVYVQHVEVVVIESHVVQTIK